jgi:hypothetical protein
MAKCAATAKDPMRKQEYNQPCNCDAKLRIAHDGSEQSSE